MPFTLAILGRCLPPFFGEDFGGALTIEVKLHSWVKVEPIRGTDERVIKRTLHEQERPCNDRVSTMQQACKDHATMV